MNHPGYATLLPKIPAGLTTGKNTVVMNTMDAGAAFTAKAAEIAKNDYRTAKGNAQVLNEYAKSTAVPALLKSRRQHAWHEKRLETKRETLRTEVVGTHDPLDGERRQVLREMAPGARIAAVLQDPSLRAAALRGGPALAGVPAAELDRAYTVATEEMHPAKVAEIATLEAGQEFHAAALRIFAHDLENANILVDANGGVRKFDSVHEFEKYLEAVPAPPFHIQSHEQIEADKNEA